MSDHGGFSELVQTVTEINPRKTYVHHGYRASLSRYLNDLGYPAADLAELGGQP